MNILICPIRCLHRNFFFFIRFLIGIKLYMWTVERFWVQVLIVLNHDLCFAWWLCSHTFKPSMTLWLRYNIYDVMLHKRFFLWPNLHLVLFDGLLDMDFFLSDNIISYRIRFDIRWFHDQNLFFGRLTFLYMRILFLINLSVIGNILYENFFLRISFVYFRNIIQITFLRLILIIFEKLCSAHAHISIICTFINDDFRRPFWAIS